MLSILAIAITGLIALLSLRDGFSGDQALFLIYAKAIDNGAVLYKDVWDIKQPAIIVFYFVAGKLFGFTEIGIHLMEIIYWLCLSLIMILGLRSYFKNPLFAAITPLFTIGIYYSVSGSLHLTQAESLVGFPLFICFWFCQKFLEDPDKKYYLFLSGLFGGIVLTFKLMFIAILFAFWICFFLYCFFTLFKKNGKQTTLLIGLLLLGSIIPIASVIIYFAYNGALHELWYTTFVYPYNAVIEITTMRNRNQVLMDGLEWSFKSYFPVVSLTFIYLLLNALSLFYGWRHNLKFSLSRENFFFIGLIIWSFSGFTVILIQRLSWWEYHYSLLMLPLGILAVKGVEELLEKIKANNKFRGKTPAFILLAVLIILLFIPTARRLVHKVGQANQIETIEIGDRKFGVTGSALEDYKSISADVALLKKEKSKTSIFVVSNPLYYYLSDSPPLFSSNGAMSDMFTDFEWKRLNLELSQKLPNYIVVEHQYLQMIKEKDPYFINTLNESYSISSFSDRVRFFKLK